MTRTCEDLKDALIYAKKLAMDEEERVLVWTNGGTSAFPPIVAERAQTPLAYTPPYLTTKILAARADLAGEHKQVTVLFADLKGSMDMLQ
jgi:hypothetical protein